MARKYVYLDRSYPSKGHFEAIMRKNETAYSISYLDKKGNPHFLDVFLTFLDLVFQSESRIEHG